MSPEVTFQTVADAHRYVLTATDRLNKLVGAVGATLSSPISNIFTSEAVLKRAERELKESVLELSAASAALHDVRVSLAGKGGA